ncbi:MAG: GYD domain-containing protein [Sulfolobaceae archaeon]
MVVFIVLSRLTDEGAETILKNPDRIREVNKEFESYGAKVLEQYVVFGDFDFVNIVEVQDPEKFLKALVELNSRGTIRTTSYLAIKVDRFIEIMKSR